MSKISQFSKYAGHKDTHEAVWPAALLGSLWLRTPKSHWEPPLQVSRLVSCTVFPPTCLGHHQPASGGTIASPLPREVKLWNEARSPHCRPGFIFLLREKSTTLVLVRTVGVQEMLFGDYGDLSLRGTGKESNEALVNISRVQERSPVTY